MSERETLLPCPFCGAECGDGIAHPMFQCISCGATARSAEAWNRRILPPGSDPSPAAPAHTTDAMERAREVVDSMVVDFGSDAARWPGRWRNRIAAAITSAVEQERQACAEIVEGVPYKHRYRQWPLAKTRYHDASNESEVAIHCDALADAIRSRSAETPDAEGGE